MTQGPWCSSSCSDRLLKLLPFNSVSFSTEAIEKLHTEAQFSLPT